MDTPGTRDYKEEVYKLPAAIDAWLTASGMKQGELAEQLGVSQQTISEWKRGTATPTVKNLAQLGRLLDVDPFELGRALLEVEGSDPPMDRVGDLERRLKRLEEIGLGELPDAPDEESRPG